MDDGGDGYLIFVIPAGSGYLNKFFWNQGNEEYYYSAPFPYTNILSLSLSLSRFLTHAIAALSLSLSLVLSCFLSSAF